MRGVAAQDAARLPASSSRRALTVGADGIRSAGGEQADAPVLQRGRTASAVLYRYVEDLPTVGYEWGYGDRAAAGLIPTNAGATCVFVGTTPARMRRLRRAGAEAAFATLLGSAAPELADRVLGAGGSTRCAAGAGCLGTCGSRGALAGHWSVTPATSRTRSPPTASPTGCATPSCSRTQILATLGGRVPEAVALAAYQATRDRLSAQLFAATEEVAGYDWDAARARQLLRRVSSAMSDEVDHLAAASGYASSAPVSAAFLPTDNASSRWVTWLESGRTARRDDHASGCSGLRGRRRRRPGVTAEQWTRRRPRRWSRSSRSHRPTAAPRAGDRGAVARASRRDRRVPGCTRRPTTRGARSAATGARRPAQRHGGAAPGRRGPRRRRRVPATWPGGPGRAVRRRPPSAPSPSTRVRCFPTTCTNHGPQRRASPFGLLHLELLR